MIKIRIPLFVVASLLLVFSCSDNQQDENDTFEIIQNTFFFNGNILVADFQRDTDGTLTPLMGKDYEELKNIYESNPTLIEIYGLDDTGTIHLFSSQKSYYHYLRTTGRCNYQRDACDGGGGSGGGGSTTTSIYKASNMRIFIDSYSQKELDWTSTCYYYTGTTANKNRVKDFNNNTSNYWRFRNSSTNCFPAGISNPSDKPSSFRLSPLISSIQIFEDHNYSGRSKIFYRNQAGLIANQPNFFIDSNGWMVINRLKDWQMGFLCCNTWDDDVSSIRLN